MKKSWTIELGGTQHTIELEHNSITGKRTIRLDGNPVEQSSKFNDTGGTYKIPINGSTCTVLIKTNGITYSYDCLLDGVSVETGKEVQAPPPSAPIPKWAWIFVVACVLIPIIALGGAVPAAIGIGGAYGCVAISRKAEKSTETRLLLCIGVTFLCWILFLLFFLAVSYLTG
jgi:hypothetical protein